MNLLDKFCFAVAIAIPLAAQQAVDVVPVISKPVERTVRLPGEFWPYLKADLYSRVSGFVEKVNVDRGSVVKEGDLLAVLSAPELTAQRAEAESKVQAIESQLDPKTRTMPVELDVRNPNHQLAPGMYPEVQWPVRSGKAALLVPPSSIVTTTERTFVIRVRNGRAEYVTISRGAPAGDLVQVVGPLNPGDEIVRRGSDETREGTVLNVRRQSRQPAQGLRPKDRVQAQR